MCESYSAVTKVDCEFNSDHSIPGFSILVKTSSRSGICRTVYNYKRANIEAIRADLCNENLADVVSGANDVNRAWSLWSSAVIRVIDKLVPKIVIRNTTQPPWCDSEVRHAINKKKTGWRKARKK